MAYPWLDRVSVHTQNLELQAQFKKLAERDHKNKASLHVSCLGATSHPWAVQVNEVREVCPQLSWEDAEQALELCKGRSAS